MLDVPDPDADAEVSKGNDEEDDVRDEEDVLEPFETGVNI